MRRVVAWAVLAAFAALLIPLVVEGQPRRAALIVLVVAVGGAALRRLVPLVEADEPDDPGMPRLRFRRTRWEPTVSLSPSLRRFERMVHFGPKNTYTASHRLLPRLRALASDRLRTHMGVDLEESPEEARAVLGEAAWELLRPDWAEGRRHFDPGPSLDDLEMVVEAVERV